MKSTYYITITIILFLQLFASAQTANWSAVLPSKFPTNASGQIHGLSRVSQLKFHPTDPNKMYAVSARGGLFISTDAGANYVVAPGTDNMPSCRLASICIDYTNDQILYLGTGDHNYYYNGIGVWKSTNGGLTFSQTTLTGKLVIDMIMDPIDHNTIVAITNVGIYKTINAGTSWTLKTTSRPFDDLKQRTPVSRVLFAATTDSAFFRSTDFGDTWSQITSGIIFPAGITNGNGCRIAVTPADTNIVYLGMVANSGLIYKSTNAGVSFSAIKTTVPPYLTYYDNLSTSSGQGDYNFGIGVDRVNANILYLVAHNVWKSIDGGATWSQLTNWYAKVHTDMHQIITSPYNNSQLYDVNDGGVWLSTDAGNNWIPKSDGINGYEIYHGNCSPTSKQTISIGTQDNGELYSNSTNWLTNRGGDWSSQCAFDYRVNSTMVYYFQNNKRRLVNGSDVTYGLPTQVTLLQGITFHRNNPNLAYVADTIIYRTNNLTVTTPTWTQIANFNKKIMAIHCSYADTNRLYVITNDGFIYVSTNATTATPTFTAYTVPSATNTAAKITTIKTAPNTVYITCNNKVYKSIDNCVTWTNITYNLPTTNHVGIISDEYSTSNDLILLATFNTVYYKIGNATSWSIFNTNLPSRTDVIDLSIFNDGTPNTSLRIATYGRSMWETSMNSLRALTANFVASNTNPCIGSSVQFSDLSFGNVTSRNWSFIGGTPATSTLQNPAVVYSSAGTYNVTLTVSDGVTNNSSTQTNYISTIGSSLPLSESFEGTIDPPTGWKNIDNGTISDAWAKSSLAGGFALSTNSMMFDNYSWNIIGQKDELQVKRLNLNGYSNAKIYFDVAYQVYTGYADSLAVLISTDCGNTFSRIYIKGGSTLTSAGSGTNNFTPTSAQWRTDTISLNTYLGQQDVILEFQNINGFGNKIYIDNVNVVGTLCISASTPTVGATSNPLCSGNATTLSIQSGNLNNSTNWKWYSGTCGGTLVGTGTSISVSPISTTNYFVRGESGCAPSGGCGNINIAVNNPVNWYLDADVDGYYTGPIISACVSPGIGYSTTIKIAGDCNDNVATIHPGATEICGNAIDDNCNGTIDEGCTITLNLKVFIQGFYNVGSLMTSPLSNPSFPLLCDTITVELHQAVPVYGLAYSVKKTINTSGNGQFIFPAAVLNNSYYIVVRHRNSIETWSKNPVLFSGLTVNYDFSTP